MPIIHSVRNHIWKIIAAIISLLLLIPILFTITELTGRTNIAIYNSPYSVIAWAQIIGAIGSVTLSGLLAVLYLLMFQTQKQQVETMQQQKEWMEIQHRPEVLVTEYNITDTIPQAKEKIEVKIQNSGNGLAKNLYIRCDIRVSGREWSTEPVEDKIFDLDGRRFKIKPHYSWLRTPEEARDTLILQPFSKRISGGFLNAGQHQWYEAPIRCHLVEEDENDEFSGGRGYAIQDAMLLLHEAGVESVLLQVSVVYRDMGGNIGLEQVFGSPATLSHRFTVEQIASSPGGGGISQIDILNAIRNDNPFPPDSIAGSDPTTGHGA